MRISFEIEDDNEEEFRVELFTSKKELRTDDVIGLCSSALGNLVALEDAEARLKSTREMMDSMRASFGAAPVIYPEPSEPPTSKPDEPRYAIRVDEDKKE